MCNICRQWRIRANYIWNQVFGEYKRFKVMIPRLPSPIRETGMSILEEINWKADQIDDVIEKLSNHPVKTNQEFTIFPIQEQFLTNGKQLLDFLKKTSDSTQKFLETESFSICGMRSSFPFFDSINQIQTQWSTSIQELQEDRKRLLQILSEHNIMELKVDVTSDQFDLRWRKKRLIKINNQNREE